MRRLFFTVLFLLGPLALAAQVNLASPAITGVLPPSKGAVASAVSFGAVDDNSTDNTAAFAAMEAASGNDFYLPYINTGVYKTTQTNLTKRYWGPGSISFLGGGSRANFGTPGILGSTKLSGLHGVGVFLSDQVQDITFIGDSITEGYVAAVATPTNYIFSIPYRLQAGMNEREGGIGQGGWLSGAQDNQRYVYSGTETTGTHGPISASSILAAGSSMSFTGGYIGNVIVSYYQAAGAGTITVSGQAGTWGTCNTSTGTGEQKCSTLASPDGVDYSMQTITLACSGGPCEITNIIGATLPVTSNTSSFVQVVSHGGYTTANYTSSAALNSIAFNRQFTAGADSIAVVELINDMVNPSVALTPSVYQANLDTITTGLITRGITPYLVVPFQTSPTSTYQPIYGTWAQFRDGLYQVARKYEVPVIDLSELDLAAGNLFGPDGLHPSLMGYGAIADYLVEKYGFGRMTYEYNGVSQPLTAGSAPGAGPMNVTLRDDTNAYRGNLFCNDATVVAVSTWALKSCGYESAADLVLNAGGYLSPSSKIHLQIERVDVGYLDSSGFSLGGGAHIANSSNLPQTSATAATGTCTLNGYIPVTVNGVTLHFATCN